MIETTRTEENPDRLRFLRFLLFKIRYSFRHYVRSTPL